MSQHTSPIPPDVPQPPIAKAIAVVFSAVMTLGLIAFIGFIAVEFAADMIGYPLFFTKSDPEEENLLPVERNTEEFKSLVELITPKHHTHVQGPEVVVIYTVRKLPAVTPDLRVNDVRHSWETQFGENTWFARLSLPEGLHYLQAGETEVEFFVTTSDATTRLPIWLVRHTPHPDTNQIDRCIDCHDMPPGQNGALGVWRGASSCFACHDEKEHAIAHRFVPTTADRTLRCVRGHTIH